MTNRIAQNRLAFERIMTTKLSNVAAVDRPPINSAAGLRFE